MSPDLIDAAVADGAKGIVDRRRRRRQHDQAGARRARQRRPRPGVVVVRSTRLPSGLVLRNNEVNDDKMGFVASGELNRAEGRACCCSSRLTKTNDPKQIQRMFDEY